MSRIVEEAIRLAKNHTGTWTRTVAQKRPTEQVPQTNTHPYLRPPVEPSPVWPPADAQLEQLKETAILSTGRQSFYLQTVNAVYAAMDRAEASRKVGLNEC